MSPTVNRPRALVLWIVAIALGFVSPAVRGQQAAQPTASPGIASLVEPGEGLAIRGTSATTGLVTFAASAGRAVCSCPALPPRRPPTGR